MIVLVLTLTRLSLGARVRAQMAASSMDLVYAGTRGRTLMVELQATQVGLRVLTSNS